MKKDTNWLIFILGMISGVIILPCIEEMLSVFLLWIEWFKILPSKLIAKGNKDIAELHIQDDTSESFSNAIGFQIPDIDNEYSDEEYDE